MRHLYLLIAFLFFANIASAQQYPLFTNYLMNRYGFNPAINMDTIGAVANLVYRKQWVGIEGAPETMLAGARGKSKMIPLGLGGYVFNDKAGVIKRNGAYGMFNYVQQIGKDTRISVGAAIGFYKFKLDPNFRATNQVDQLVPSALDGKGFLDFNAGLYLTSKDFYAGFSVPQVEERQLSFSDQPAKSVLQRHYYALFGYKLKLNEKMGLEPSVLFKYVQNAPLQYEAGAKLNFDKFWIGGAYRKNDAITAYAGVDFGNMSLGYAYDITTSSLNTVSNGTHELSLEMRFGKPKDTDNDGCPDKDDKCPDKPGPKDNDCCPLDEVADSNGDRDGDGVPDKDDKCPDTPGPKENQGCPWGDRDGDGIRDDIDKCPDLPGVASNQGCPIDDRDQDGIVDKFDKCPDEAGPLRNEGCPFSDRDGDGIADADDNCPDSRGAPGSDGCPIASAGELEILNLAMRNVYFDSDKSDIWKESHPFLDKLAELIVKKGDWKLRVKGHTDATASDEHNVSLSKRRSEAVMFYMMNRGVKREQLMVEYYGEGDPFANNASEGGRQLNRRVELEFIFK